MGAYLDLTGYRFGRLIVIERVEATASNKQPRWRCVCDCGGETRTAGQNLRLGKSLSCGCYQRQRAGNQIAPLFVQKVFVPSHGHATRHGMSPEYAIWRAMKNRCVRPQTPSYKYYGARGIRVCDEWMHSFAAFLRDVGVRPARHLTLDRINNDGNYEPGNVRWTTWSVQNTNKRRRRSRTVINS